MNFRFYIDPETGDPHILRHRVSEEEVKEISFRQRKTDLVVTGRDYWSAEQRKGGLYA